jgi:hypothetical protein
MTGGAGAYGKVTQEKKSPDPAGENGTRANKARCD